MTHVAAPASPVVTDAAAPARAPSWLRLGIVFGLVSAASILLWGPIGVSGTYSRFVGWLGASTSLASNPYVIKMGSVLKPETFLVIGLAIGGFLAARLSHYRAPASEFVHARETSTKRRYVDAFLGGLLIIFGARLAGGCTSGHIISGITQLSVSGMLFAAATFASGILTAKTIRRSKEG